MTFFTEDFLGAIIILIISAKAALFGYNYLNNTRRRFEFNLEYYNSDSLRDVILEEEEKKEEKQYQADMVDIIIDNNQELILSNRSKNRIKLKPDSNTTVAGAFFRST